MILGIDYGLANIGLATSEGELAEPYGTIKSKNLEDGIKKVEQVCKTLDIETIIMGVSEGKMAEQTRNFGNKLSSVLRLPVKFVDETLSSVEATSGKRKDKGKDHKRAAAIILQRYLDERS